MRRKLAVILAADVAGYSRLVAEDEDDTLRRLTGYMSVFKDYIGRHDGRVFNTAGDAVLAEFGSAIDAVRCAIDVQESFRTRNLAYPASRQMNFRIGITLGDVVEDSGDLLGDGVNIAARLESIAPAGGICVSRAIHDAVASKIAVKFVDGGQRQLKNMPEPVHAYMIHVGQGSENGAKGEPSTATPPTASRRMTILATAGAAAAIAVLVGGYFALQTPSVPLTPVPEAKTAAAPSKVTSQPAPVATVPSAQPAATQTPPAVSAPVPLPPTTPPKAEVKQPAATSSGQQTAVVDPGRPPAADPAPPQSPPIPPPNADRQVDACRGARGAEAIALCTAAAAIPGLDKARVAETNYRLGRALRDADQHAAAINAYARSLEARPTPEAYIHRGVARFDMRAFDDAIADFDAALRLAPSNGEALNNRAWTLYRKGEHRAAIVDADKAVAALSTEGYVWDTRGHIHEALGNKAEAIRDYRQAIALDPSTASSRDGLRRLGASP